MREELAGGLVLFLFGGATVFLSMGMPLGSLRMPGPGMFPLALGVLLMLLSGVSMVRLVWGQGAVGPSPSWRPALKGVFCFVGAMALCILLLGLLGYPLASLLLLLVLFRLMGSRAWGLNTALALGVAGISYLVFVRWLQVPLPRGFLGL